MVLKVDKNIFKSKYVNQKEIPISREVLLMMHFE